MSNKEINNDRLIKFESFEEKDKAYLKTIEEVKSVEHTENFSKNLVEASDKVSSEVSELVKSSDNEYIEEVENMVINMRKMYLENSKERDDN